MANLIDITYWLYDNSADMDAGDYDREDEVNRLLEELDNMGDRAVIRALSQIVEEMQ